jgi:hypothetical protein
MHNILRYTLLENQRARFTLAAVVLIGAIAAMAHYSSVLNYNAGRYTLTVLAFGLYFTRLVLLAFALLAPVLAVTRSRYLLGKYAAFLLLYGLLAAAAALALAILAFAFGTRDDPAPLRLPAFVAAEWMSGAVLLALVFALAMAVRSALLPPLLGAAIFFISFLLEYAREAATPGASSAVRLFYTLLYYAFPNFRLFHTEKAVLYGLSLPPAHWVALGAYTLLTAGVFLSIALVLFRRREL